MGTRICRSVVLALEGGRAPLFHYSAAPEHEALVLGISDLLPGS
jgi:hypothetical protein